MQAFERYAFHLTISNRKTCKHFFTDILKILIYVQILNNEILKSDIFVRILEQQNANKIRYNFVQIEMLIKLDLNIYKH